MSRPARSRTLTSKLTDTSNVSAPELSFQRKAVQEFHAARQGQAALTASEDASGPSLSARTTDPHMLSTTSTPHKKRAAPTDPDDSDKEDSSPCERRTFFF
jgi:hypothetical protein